MSRIWICRPGRRPRAELPSSGTDAGSRSTRSCAVILALVIAASATPFSNSLISGQARADGVAAISEVRKLGRCAGCILSGGHYFETRLTGLDLSGAQIDGTSFVRADLSVARFDGAVIEDVSFDGADLGGASFVNARLRRVTFRDANLRGAVFDGALLEETDLQAARLCSTQLPDDVLDSSDCG